MEQYKQIVYRNEDQVLVIVPENENIDTKVVFLEAIETDLKIKLDALKNLCLSKIDGDLKYVVAFKGTNILNIENNKGTLQLDITEVPTDELLVITNAISTCLQILNS